MIITDSANKSSKRKIVSVVTAEGELEVIKILLSYNFDVHSTQDIPVTIDAYKTTPDAVIIDSTIDNDWEEKVKTFQKIDAFSHIPVVVLNSKVIPIKEIFSQPEKDFFIVQRENSEAILQAVIAATKYSAMLNNALVKTNELNRILSTNYLVLDTKNECLESIQTHLESIDTIVPSEVRKEINVIKDLIAKNLKEGDHYQLFKAHFEEVHPLFFRKLLAKNANLSNNDLKLATFLKMGFNNSEISFFMGISMAGTKKALQRLRRRLGLNPDESLRKFINTIEH